MRHPGIYVAPSKLGGRGVFTNTKLDKGELLEVCPAIVLKKGDIELIDKTTLYDYYFLWGDDQKQCCIALGYGSLYNHNAPSNADYSMDYEAHLIEIFTVRIVEAGEEITINYNGDPNDDTPPWFMKK